MSDNQYILNKPPHNGAKESPFLQWLLTTAGRFQPVSEWPAQFQWTDEDGVVRRETLRADIVSDDLMQERSAIERSLLEKIFESVRPDPIPWMKPNALNLRLHAALHPRAQIWLAGPDAIKPLAPVLRILEKAKEMYGFDFTALSHGNMVQFPQCFVFPEPQMPDEWKSSILIMGADSLMWRSATPHPIIASESTEQIGIRGALQISAPVYLWTVSNS